MPQQYDVILLGGLSGRLDQTVHTLSYLHKLRKIRRRIYAVSDDNIGWVLDEVNRHHISSRIVVVKLTRDCRASTSFK
jgi:thiamine pyrophosphokinase